MFTQFFLKSIFSLNPKNLPRDNECEVSVKILNMFHFCQRGSIWRVKWAEIKSEETLALL